MPAGRKKTQTKHIAVEPLIRNIRGERVILDADLARIYGVTTKRLNEQVKRNRQRFPGDFVFCLTKEETYCLLENEELFADRARSAAGSKDGCCRGARNLRSQFATSSSGYGGRRYLPYAFTERGALMAANVLNSRSAIQMSVFVVRAFVRMKKMLISPESLAEELAVLKKELRERLAGHDRAINDILRRIILILDPPRAPASPKRGIGFHVKY